jgi:hypothetical protein
MWHEMLRIRVWRQNMNSTRKHVGKYLDNLGEANSTGSEGKNGATVCSKKSFSKKGEDKNIELFPPKCKHVAHGRRRRRVR